MIRKIDAILSLMPEADVTVIEDTTVIWNDKDQAPLTDHQINTEIARLQAQHDATEYQRQRAKEYPDVNVQLDTLYHQGFDAWKATITAVKNKYAKPADKKDK